jgi:hypothetical protein
MRQYKLLVPILMAVLVLACGKKTTEPETHTDEIHAEFSYTPNPATVNTPVELKFEVEHDGEHTNVAMASCELEKEGSGNHVEVTLKAEEGETGHYVGTHTFTSAGSYEVHFGFMFQEANQEEKFSIVVQ